MSLSTDLSAMTRVVARMMRMPPQMSRVVMVCPSTRTLNITAETGSSAPRMAVGVEPIS